MELRTKKQKERDARNRAIASDFLEIRKQNPRVFSNRIYDVLADKYGKTNQTIRNILIDMGVIHKRVQPYDIRIS